MLKRAAVVDCRIPPTGRQTVLHRGTGRTAHVGNRIPPFGAGDTVRGTDGGRDHGHERQRRQPSSGDGRDTTKDFCPTGRFSNPSPFDDASGGSTVGWCAPNTWLRLGRQITACGRRLRHNHHVGTAEQQTAPRLRVFCSYAHEDIEFCEALRRHLRGLEHNQVIEFW